MLSRPFNRLVLRIALSSLVLTILVAAPLSRAEMLWGTMQRAGLDMTLVVDKSIGKVCIQASGPADGWFGWGFGSSTMSGYALIFNAYNDGNYFETVMDFAVQPSPQSQQDVTASYSINSGTITYTAFRKLDTGDANDYKGWASGQNLISWAVGSRPFNMHYNRNAETIAIASAPAPKISEIQHNQDAGSTTLTLQNLSPAATNKIEFVNALGTTNWTTISNVIFSGQPGGPSLATFMTSLSASVATGNTNAAGFYRIRQ